MISKFMEIRRCFDFAQHDCAGKEAGTMPCTAPVKGLERKKFGVGLEILRGGSSVHDKECSVYVVKGSVHDKERSVYVVIRSVHDKERSVYVVNRSVHDKECSVYVVNRSVHDKERSVY